MEPFILAGLFLFGLCAGSFLNVLVYRFSKRENLKGILTGRSYCPSCKNQIAWYDNIPILSYIVLKGRCRHCGWKIPLRYPVVELIGGLTPVVVYELFKPYGWITVLSLTLFLYLLTVIAFIDWNTYEIPDELSIGGTVLGLILSLFRSDISPKEAFAAAAIGALIVVTLILLYYWLKGVVPLGLGDAKLLALIGAFEGFGGIYCALFAGSLAAISFFLPQILKNRTLQFTVPFAPFLAIGAALGLLCKKTGLLPF